MPIDFPGGTPVTFDVIGYDDWGHYRHKGVPENPQDASGMIVRVTDPDNPRDTQVFLAPTLTRFEEWSEWWVYIGGLIVRNYGLELADG